MAASKRSRSSGGNKPVNRKSVPVGGGAAKAGKSVARRGARAGAVPQEPAQRPEAVPDPRPQEPTGDVPTSGNHPIHDANVWNAAISRAAVEDLDKRTAWNTRVEAYIVPSGSDPTTSYIVKRDRSLAGKPAFIWEHFKCSCAAGERGFLVCKHKAAVWLYRRANRERLARLYGE